LGLSFCGRITKNSGWTIWY